MKSEILKLDPQGNFAASVNVVARLLIVGLFFLAGVSKISAYDATAGWMEAMGVPGALLPLVIIAEVLGALLLIIGFQTRFVALGLAIFTLVSAFVFHLDFSDQTQFLMFYKNLSITGGFLILMLLGAGRFSLDGKLNQ
ncbi:DoxX family protein [Aliiglaciecola sp. CAU 1673]|uniref:DoxX family protein n=1 Tax=Aliiglaciecola sp. CAU 1673 TaxID=3032595 RepID=UPI0023DC264C|nr:DoxX family protein [Aliiglaciecola sp. CAU 1673]MDF2179458.1 DoxX family protein [Aliiglaciecola sp. CAU 1673]